MTSKHMYRLALDKTRAKAKASTLIDRANQIRNLRPNGTPIAAFYEARLDEFRAILESAKDTGIPLRGKELFDVFVAMSSNLSSLGFCKSAGCVLMLETLEGLGTAWNKVRTREPEERRFETERLDEAKYEIFGQLSSGSGISFSAEIRDASFDRLCAILHTVKTPSVLSRLAADMQLIEWYIWYPKHLGGKRYTRLLNFVEINVDKIDDPSKLRAIVSITTPLEKLHKENADISKDFSRLCSITGSISNDDTKADATVHLTGRGDWVPEGAARTAAREELAALIASITSPSAKARAEAALIER